VRILGRFGYRVLCAANGVEALEVAAKHSGPIDLLFTDAVMPGMNLSATEAQSTTCASPKPAKPGTDLLISSAPASTTNLRNRPR
jgi:CheY-like chemotaxis protein